MKLRVEQDTQAKNPREEGQHLGKIVHWHPRCDLGERIDGPKRRQDILPAGTVFLPISLFDHSCLRLWVGILKHWSDPRGGNSGHVGYIYATPETISKVFKGGDATDPDNIAKVRRTLRGEIERFDQYLRGDVWKFVVEDNAGKELESCGDYWGREFAESAGREALGRFQQDLL